MPTTTGNKNKNKKQPTTKPDLRKRYRWVGQVGSLAGVSKLWTALGKGPASRAIGKALAADESYTLHWQVHYHFPQWQTIVSGWGNSYSVTWWLQRVLRGQRWHQVSLLLHRRVFQVRLGKSTLTTRLVALSSRVLTRTSAHVLVFYSLMQPAYRELARQALCPVQLLDGAKHFTKQLTTECTTASPNGRPSCLAGGNSYSETWWLQRVLRGQR